MIKTAKTCIIDVGGGLRDIFSAGVLDRFLDEGLRFDLCVGVSAGSANLASFMAGQRGRTLKFYTEYAMRPQYMSFGNILKTGSYLDLDYAYSVLSDSRGEYPLDYAAMEKDPAELIVVASDALSGIGRYFTKADVAQDNYDVMKASSSIPFISRPYVIGGRPYYDGALFDPVPARYAERQGCDRIVLLLSKPRDLRREVGKDAVLARLVKSKYPLAAKNLLLRAKRYNEGVDRAKELEREGRAIILAPEDTCGVDTLTKNPEKLRKLYALGLKEAEKAFEFVK